MKQLLYRLNCWWFATMTPVRTPLTTISEREKQRKRRLFSIILLINAVSQFPFIPLGIITHINAISILGNIILCVLFLCLLWVNQRGYLILASLFFLIFGFLGMAVLCATVTQSFNYTYVIFIVWAILLILPVIAGIILPVWGPPLIGTLVIAFMGWFILVERQSRLIAYTRMSFVGIAFFSTSGVIISMVTLFSAISTAATKKAVIQADRAIELEQAHHELSKAYATIQRQALTDALTGLPNHRAIMDQFDKEIARAQRYERPFAVLFFDADRFKKVNDTYGHAAGDAVLHEIGKRARHALRGGDTVGRFGGEEFVILLPEVGAHAASVVAERIRATVAGCPVDFPEVEGGLSVTISIGLAAFPGDGSSAQELLLQADEAMYIAKRLGRNQVRTAQEAREIATNEELVAVMQQESQLDLLQRDGNSALQSCKTKTVKLMCLLLDLLAKHDKNLSADAIGTIATALSQQVDLPAEEISIVRALQAISPHYQISPPDAQETRYKLSNRL